MKDIFIQALVTRSHTEADLIDKLPEEVRVLVEEKLSTELVEEVNENTKIV